MNLVTANLDSLVTHQMADSIPTSVLWTLNYPALVQHLAVTLVVVITVTGLVTVSLVEMASSANSMQLHVLTTVQHYLSRI
jgi:hypothetical protein